MRTSLPVFAQFFHLASVRFHPVNLPVFIILIRKINFPVLHQNTPWADFCQALCPAAILSRPVQIVIVQLTGIIEITILITNTGIMTVCPCIFLLLNPPLDYPGSTAFFPGNQKMSDTQTMNDSALPIKVFGGLQYRFPFVLHWAQVEKPRIPACHLGRIRKFPSFHIFSMKRNLLIKIWAIRAVAVRFRLLSQFHPKPAIIILFQIRRQFHPLYV